MCVEKFERRCIILSFMFFWENILSHKKPFTQRRLWLSVKTNFPHIFGHFYEFSSTLSFLTRFFYHMPMNLPLFFLSYLFIFRPPFFLSEVFFFTTLLVYGKYFFCFLHSNFLFSKFKLKISSLPHILLEFLEHFDWNFR